MDSKKKRKEQFHDKLEMTRRSFLGGTGVLAASAALVTLRGREAHAATSNSVSAQLPDRYGSAHVALVPTTEKNLGSSRIIGPIKQISEKQTGFSRAALDEWGRAEAVKRSRFVGKYPLSAALNQTLAYLADDKIVGANVPPAPNKLPIPDPERMSKHIKELCYFLRADEVGIGVMRHHGSYSERLLSRPNPETRWFDYRTEVEDNSQHKYVIAVLIDQDLRTTLGSTGYDGISASQSFRSYSNTGFVSVILADYIRRLGYSARAHHARNYNMILAPNLISAGMGEQSRAQESIMHPRLGFRTKAAIVSTDLPLAPDTPIEFGGQEFCRVCKKCAEQCPAKAISTATEQDEYNGYMRWSGDVAKCTMFRIGNEEGAACGRCMKVCPWNNKEDSWFHAAGLNAAGRFPSVGGPILRDIDDIFGYGTEQIEEFKWWLEWPELYKYPK
jgi:reductive dehalogenase